MRLPNVFSKTMRDLRWQVFWYGVGLAILGAFVVYVYPSYKEQLAEFEIPEALRALIGSVSYATPEGFLTAEFFSWAPALLAVFAIMAGTSAIGGEEESGTLDLLLAQPIERSRLVIEKIAALILSALAISLLIYLGWLASVPFVAIDISYGRLLVATLNLVPMVVLLGTLAICCSVVLPDRKMATGIVTALTVASYIGNYLAELVNVLDPLRYASVFYYYDGTNVLSKGIDPAKLGVLLVLSLFFSALAVAAFRRRDIGVHGGLTLPRLLRLTAAPE